MARRVKGVADIWRGEPSRIVLFERLAKAGITHRRLSLAMGENHDFINSYLFRSGYLTEQRLKQMAVILEMDDAALKLKLNEQAARAGALGEVSRRPSNSRLNSTAERKGSTEGLPAWSDGVPLYPMTGAIDAACASTFTKAEVSALPTFAIWISADHGRLAVGDIAFVNESEPARSRDLVAVISGRHIRVIGTLMTGDAPSIITANGSVSIAQDERILKIVGVKFA